MGNLIEGEDRPKTYVFIESLERSFLTQYMIEDML